MKPIHKTELSTLYNGDCVDIMIELIAEGTKVDKVITSPPYNTMRNGQCDVGYDVYQDSINNQAYINWIVEIFETYDKLVNPNGCIMWNMSYGTENTTCMNLTIAEILKRTKWTLADIIVWKKPTATPNNVSSNKMTRICEFVYVFCRQSEFYTFTSNKKKISESENTHQAIYENVYNFISAPNNDDSTDLNKATFSTGFVDALIDRYVTPTDIVLDNFSGTGTTMVACECRNRKGIYIELSTAQCEYTIKRLSTGVQLNLFDMV